MRLLHTKTLQFHEFFDAKIPPYAILSHRWGEGEVTFKEIRKGKAQPGPGLTKIKKFCTLAASKGHEWAWIDTCCIDKRSSAELSESINAMYKWYRNARQCFVYLIDFELSAQESRNKREVKVRTLPPILIPLTKSILTPWIRISRTCSILISRIGCADPPGSKEVGRCKSY